MMIALVDGTRRWVHPVIPTGGDFDLLWVFRVCVATNVDLSKVGDDLYMKEEPKMLTFVYYGNYW